MSIDSFRNEYSFLSNFFASLIIINGKKYATVEHAYQALKTSDVETHELIRNAKTPAIAKRLGRAIQLKSNWDNIKIEVMKFCLQKKFENPYLRAMLISTGVEELIEKNYWGDTFWGVDAKTLKGENWLGRLLTEIRENIKNEDEYAVFK